MYRKFLLTAALAAAFVAPAFAATTWYVEQSVSTHKCAVTETKPNGTTEKQIGTTTYATKALAQTAMKAAAECKA
jgi:hypothetical protein